MVGVVDNFNDPAPTFRHTPPLKVGGASLAKIKNLLCQPQVLSSKAFTFSFIENTVNGQISYRFKLSKFVNIYYYTHHMTSYICA